MLIRTNDLAFTYAPGTPLERVALRGVTLEIGAGERLGVLGATGSGKSTLVQLLVGLLEPTAGQVWLDGVVAHQRSALARGRRQRMGLAFQYPESQFFAQTVFDELAYGPRNLGLRENQLATRVHWALDMVGLEPAKFERRVPFALSGGEMRRIALASILAMRPEVLILDEPLAGLDPSGRRNVLGRILDWQCETGATLILVSHRPGELARAVRRVVLLEGGRVVADGPVRQVLSHSELLRAAGLDVAAPVALLLALREAGWDVRTDLLLAEEAVGEIAQQRALRGSVL